eukprot:4753993-Pyramimonas_sp.AAC.1
MPTAIKPKRTQAEHGLPRLDDLPKGVGSADLSSNELGTPINFDAASAGSSRHQALLHALSRSVRFDLDNCEAVHAEPPE